MSRPDIHLEPQDVRGWPVRVRVTNPKGEVLYVDRADAPSRNGAPASQEGIPAHAGGP